jgi:transketolase
LDKFDRQDESYRDDVLPPSCRKRVAIEAGTTSLWYKYVGLDGKTVGIDRFGLSAPGGTVMKELGITKEHLVEVARTLQ